MNWNRILCRPCTLVYIALIVFALHSRNGCTIEYWVFPRVWMNPSNDACLIFPKLWGFSECCRKNLTWHCEETDSLARVRLKLTVVCSYLAETTYIFTLFAVMRISFRDRLWWTDGRCKLAYFPAHKTHFFTEKCDLHSTCVLCAEGKCYFQTYKYPYIYYTTFLSWESENSHEDDFSGSDDDFLGFYD